ncbi:MAG: 5-(carboxyamino)imidazole ribonucleotide synthase [Gammaproteobacteria bacterium]|jgi:5-(carboxyamino)imidazole ribonucleotide synthase|nr:5-(carboxyamino)imidazole ribonucleotide synthase [Gammaproteobacteria bacterium]
MKIGVLGAGQLGRMLALSAYPLGHQMRFLALSEEDPSSLLGKTFIHNNNPEIVSNFADSSDIVTYESENTDVTIVNEISKNTKVFPSDKSLYISQHRGREKALLDALKIPCAPYQMVNSLDDLKSAIKNIGIPCILKTVTDGYDGKGQFLIKSETQIQEAWEKMAGADSILEGFINFKRELSLIAVRGIDGSLEYYPLVENSHHEGILRLTIAPAENISASLQKKAEEYMSSILKEIKHVGVLTIELFESDDLLVNEIAPRVHNSGHWTIEGAQTSQFENHIRAITESPLGQTTITSKFSAMINIIGVHGPIQKVLKTKNAHLHLYNKEERTGRKLGHITLTSDSIDELNQTIGSLKEYLP